MSDKKSYVNFWRKTLPFPKKSSNVFPKQFFTVFSDTAFFEKTVEYTNIQHLIFDIKGYIRFWCKMTHYRLHSDPVAVLQTT